MSYKRASTGRRPLFTAIGILSLFLFPPESTAIFAGGAGQLRDRAVIESVTLLDEAANALGNPAADYRKILEDVRARSPRGFIEAQLATFLSRAPASGADFTCGEEFMRDRARQELWRLKDTLLDSDPQPPQPRFCYAVPYAVDTARPTKTVEVYGYDLDKAPLEIFVMNNDGFFQDVTFASVNRTHYHLTINLANDGVTFSPKSQTLAVTWGHLVRYVVPLIRSGTPLCPSWIEEIPAGKTITYPPLLLRGDGVFRGTGTRVTASATLDYESNKLDATVCMTAFEQNGARTAVSGCGVEYVFTTDPDRVIEKVFGGLLSQINYIHGSQAEDVKDGSRGSPVRRWTFAGFGGKSPAATETQVTAQFGTIRVVSSATGDCVSAIAYSEAKRRDALSPATRERLDSQLSRIDPAVRKLRPRFAPPD